MKYPPNNICHCNNDGACKAQQCCNESKPKRSVWKGAATEARPHFGEMLQVLHRLRSQAWKLIQIDDNV